MSSSRWEPAYLKDMVAWSKNPNIPMYGRWNHAADAEGGVDLTSKQGTPVYALGDGPLLGAGNFGKVGGFTYNESSSFGVVTQRITVPGFGLQDIYYQHINIDKSIRFCNNPTGSCGGQYIKRGQLIGTTGGFGEVEIGFNASWGGVWGVNHPAAWVTDPRPMILALMNMGTPDGMSSGGLVDGLGGAISTVATHIAPDATVAEFLAGIDLALELRNPFNSGALANGSPTFALNVGPASANIPDPVGYLTDLGENIINDLAALVVRGGFLFLGFIILWAMGAHLSQGIMNKALEPVGGTQGVAQLARGLA